MTDYTIQKGVGPEQRRYMVFNTFGVSLPSATWNQFTVDTDNVGKLRIDSRDACLETEDPTNLRFQEVVCDSTPY